MKKTCSGQDEATLREGNKARRRALSAHATPEDLPPPDLARLRVRAEGGLTVHDTHYIRNIRCELGGDVIEAPLEISDIESHAVALDLFSCQWGRFFNKGGDDCRMLHSRTGARDGGHVLVRPPAGAEKSNFKLIFESSSLTKKELLAIDLLDANMGMWRELDIERRTLKEGWIETVAAGEIVLATSQELASVQVAAEETFKAPVEIKKIEILSFGHQVASIDEFQPFSIRVTARHHERVPHASINLNIYRSDGVYVFYQPSGINDNNIENHLGDSVVEFHFDTNPFGMGDYSLNVFACNGFDWNNIPPSDIYDKSLGEAKFRVKPQARHCLRAGECERARRANASARRCRADGFARAGTSMIEIATTPPPFKKMLAFNSDVEFTTWRDQIALIRLFGERNLETAFSYWMFCDPTYTWRLFDASGAWTKEAPAALALARGGVFDTLHSFGGASHIGGVDINREAIERGYARLRESGVNSAIYSNHGGIQDVQNIGGLWSAPRVPPIDFRNYWAGDLVDHPCYHLDLTLAEGFRYFWLDIDRVRMRSWFDATIDKDDASLFNTQICRDGSAILRFRRTDFNVMPWPVDFAAQINTALEADDGAFCVVFNHFGFSKPESGSPIPNPPPYFDDAAYDALDRLIDRQRAGDVLVTTTERLLNFALLQAVKPWTVSESADKIVIQFNSRVCAGAVDLTLDWNDLQGFAIKVDAPIDVELRLDGESRSAERWNIDDQNFAGLTWRSLPIMDLLDDALSAPPSL